MDTKLIYEDETYAIRGAIFEVYKTLGDGYLEDVYQNALDVFSTTESTEAHGNFHPPRSSNTPRDRFEVFDADSAWPLKISSEVVGENCSNRSH